MAKKKASKPKSTSRKKPTKKGDGQSKGGVVAGLVGVIVLLGVVVSYYYEKEDPSSTSPTYSQNTEREPSDSQDLLKKQSEESSDQEEVVVQGKKESMETNPQLPDYEEVDEYYYTNSFDFAWPAYDVDDIVVEHDGFTINYDERNEQATWVAYKLERINLENAKYERKDNFREDPKVRTGSAAPDDYRKSGFDRGHLAPAADFTWSENALSETFFMSNMSPQVPGFNRGIWKKLEEQVRDWARENSILYVVTGPIIKSREKRIGKNKVTVPQSYYKVVLDIQEPELKGIAFIMSNEKSNGAILDFAVSIDKVEEATGLDFFPLLPDEIEAELEKSVKIELWR